MKDRILLIQKDATEQKVPLTKDKLIIGRDDKADIVWSGNEFSRQHVAIHYKFDIVYIENISTSGEIKIAGKAIEYAELKEGTEAVVGPYVIKWIYGDYSMLSQQNEVSGSNSDPKIVESTNNSFSGAFSQEGSAPAEVTQPSADMHSDLSKAAVPVESTIPLQRGDDVPLNSEDAQFLSEESTVANVESYAGILRILSGEIIGREIKLENGKEWIVGRAKECHVPVDHPKLSRHHFRIVQISNGYRVQDLDSSYGIKVNGVSIKDAPLKSYDTISAGPVEMQFVIIDRKIQGIPVEMKEGQALIGHALPSLLNDDHPQMSGDLHNEKTNWAPIVSPGRPSAFQYSPPNASFQHNPSSVEDAKPFNPNDPSQQKKNPFANFREKFSKQPKSRKILIGLIPVLLIALGLSTLIPDAPTEAAPPKTEAPVAQQSSSEDTANPAESGDFSAEYQLKSAKEKAEIQNLYAQAEEARNKQNWQVAHDIAQEIVKKVGRYKKTNEIIAEAQGYLTDLQIATLSKTDNDSEAQAMANQRKIEDYLVNGEAALVAQKWSEAEEFFTNALLLDHKNDKAVRGQLAARAKDANLYKTAELAIKRDQESQSSAASEAATPVAETPPTPPSEREELSLEYQASKQKIQEGAFRDAYPVLKDLKTRIESLIAQEETERNPASTALSEENRNLRSKIVESLDLINDQYVLEYKTQLDDAQQAIANQKYIEARAIYDSIIKREPYFEEPRVEREKLYKKMVGDGTTAYREGLVAESVGDLASALELYEKSKSFFESVEKKEAEEYFAVVDKKLKTLKK